MNLKSTPKHQNLIYDVGMHKGQDTDFYLKKGFNVIAFEANPENIDFCKRRFAQAIEEKRLTIVEGAIVEDAARNRQETVRFYLNKNHSFWGSTCDDWAYRNEVMGTTNEMIEIGAVDFGQTIEQYGIPNYLKADIVGSETICLRALLAFENKPDYLSIRSEKVIFSRLEDEFILLEKLGYDKFKAIQQDFANVQTTFAAPNGENITHSFEEGGSGFFGEETSGRWKDREQVLKEYRRIFTLYWLFGDYSYLIQTERGKKIIAQLERVAKRPLPGWYDTHAKHSSVNS
jgi:FkbM family methyltransferase